MTYDVIAGDLATNTAALSALLEILKGAGASVAVYLAPERSDLPPLMGGPEQLVFIEQLQSRASAAGATVIDARDAVPVEYWGWEQTVPDRSHFTEPGHKLLAQRLVERGEQAHVFDRLGEP
ncbi:MAG: hypothetical protein JNK82_34935 [Myxococcaceae bacterium]|nr:hypothetical protein [Myxococcaceae bacterium]